MNSVSQETSSFFIDSASLREIRNFLQFRPELQKVFSMPARFKVVLDANIAVADLIHKLKTPGLRQTAIEECARADTLVVYAPRWLDEEMMTSAIPQVARDKGLNTGALLALWAEYREFLVWDETFVRPERTDGYIGDVKDIPYVELQRKIDAVGILSRDKDIERLGGSALQLDFVLTVRRYARAASVHLNIYAGGTLIGVLGFAALRGIIQGVVKLFSRLPPWGKGLLLIGMTIAVLHPQSKKRILNHLKALADLGEAAIPHLLELVDMATQKQREAENALDVTESIMRHGKAADDTEKLQVNSWYAAVSK